MDSQRSDASSTVLSGGTIHLASTFEQKPARRSLRSMLLHGVTGNATFFLLAPVVPFCYPKPVAYELTLRPSMLMVFHGHLLKGKPCLSRASVGHALSQRRKHKQDNTLFMTVTFRCPAMLEARQTKRLENLQHTRGEQDCQPRLADSISWVLW